MATENPIEQEGTFPLPEAQLDRFAAKLALGYPSLDDEVRIVEEQRHAHPLESVEPVVTGRELMDIRLAAERVYIDPIVLRWLVELVRATRHLDQVSVGASVRASLALERAARAWALAHGRSFVDPEDVERLFIPVVAHRLVFEPFALAVEGMESSGSLLDSVQAECLEAGAAAPGEAGRDGRRRALRSRRLADVAAQRRRAFPLVSRHRMTGVTYGSQRSLRRGQGAEIAGSRRYVPGDRLAWIDWHASARESLARDEDVFIVRQYFEEVAPRVIVVVDRRPSMALYSS